MVLPVHFDVLILIKNRHPYGQVSPVHDREGFARLKRKKKKQTHFLTIVTSCHIKQTRRIRIKFVFVEGSKRSSRKQKCGHQTPFVQKMDDK